MLALAAEPFSAGLLKSAGGVTYTYDGNGNRVEKSNGTLYWRGLGGSVLAETDTSGNTLDEYVYFDGNRIALRDASGNVYYYFPDALGSEVSITNATGTRCFDADFYLFGGEKVFTNNCPPSYMFAGMEYDSETGLYHTLFRQYSPQYGRWLSPDPKGGDIMNPQSLNRYAYVLNNATTLTDPMGLQPPQGELQAEWRAHCFISAPCARWASMSGMTWWGDVFDVMEIPVVSSYKWVPTQFTQNGNHLYMTTGYWENTSLGNALGYFAGAPPLPQLQQPSRLNTLMLQTRVFVSTLAQNFADEFKEGGCVNTFLKGVEQADVLGPVLSGSPNIAETNINALANSVAVSYAAGRLLTVPFRSSVVRSMLQTGEAAAETFAPAYLDYLEIRGFFGREVPAIIQGKCQ